ncbi:MAG: DUF1566 domain-containing protein [Bacteroidetes bacterium]|nr:DUF1566 domain-containing protein [Bacteroidota bacterium]
MNKKLILLILIALWATASFAQNVGVNNDGSAPASSAILDVSSTTRAFLPPRMTSAQRNSISSPAPGLTIWCSNCGPSGEMQVYNGAAWTNVVGGTALGLPGAPTIGTATFGGFQASVTFTQPASDGGSPILSYTATSSPGNFTETLNQAGSGTITVTGLTNGIAYTFTVSATNANGMGLPSVVSNSVTPGIGASYGGGIIFYIDATGMHGLIAATADQSYGTFWTNPDYWQVGVPLGTSTDFGTGSANTDHTISQNPQGAYYAAWYCRSYNGGGYNDWYLPSKDELNKLYQNQELIGGFVAYNYMSSSEASYSPAGYVWHQNFGFGSKVYYKKEVFSKVRAIRSF